MSEAQAIVQQDHAAIADGYNYVIREKNKKRKVKTLAYFKNKKQALSYIQLVGDFTLEIEKLPKVSAYFLGELKGVARARRVAEILMERESRTGKALESDKAEIPKRSSWSILFEKEFGRKPKSLEDVAYLTGAPFDIVKRIWTKGYQSWSKVGHSPGSTAYGWAMARVQAFVLGGPLTRNIDKEEYAELLKVKQKIEQAKIKRSKTK